MFRQLTARGKLVVKQDYCSHWPCCHQPALCLQAYLLETGGHQWFKDDWDPLCHSGVLLQQHLKVPQYLSSKLQYLHYQHCSFEPSHWYMWTHVVWNCLKKRKNMLIFFALEWPLFQDACISNSLIEHYFFWMTWILIWLKLISSCTQNLSGMTVPKSLQ